jgi:hypothetical protein
VLGDDLGSNDLCTLHINIMPTEIDNKYIGFWDEKSYSFWLVVVGKVVGTLETFA